MDQDERDKANEALDMLDAMAEPAFLKEDPTVLHIENNWFGSVYLVQKRYDGKRAGWFVVAVAGGKPFWEGHYSFRKAQVRFDAQIDYLRALLDQLQPSPEPAPASQRTHLTAEQWEKSWGIVTRRLTGGPANFIGSPEVQRLKVDLDEAFLLGDADGFSSLVMQFVHRCQDVAKERGIKPWWLGQDAAR